ncbi:hypothetical protein ACXWOP_09825, partial [Streptococcus pyogenes]
QRLQLHDCAAAPTLAALQESLALSRGGTLVLNAPARLTPECHRWLVSHLLEQELKGDKEQRTLALFDDTPEQLVESH